MEQQKPVTINTLEFFFVLLFVFSSFADVRFSIGGKGFFTLSQFEIASYLLLLPLLASEYLRRHSARTISSTAGALGPALLASYFSWCFLSVLLVRGETAKTMLIDLKLGLAGLIGYFAILLTMTSLKKARLVLAAWTCAGMLNVLLAFSQHFLGGPHPVAPGENALDKLDIGGEVARSLVTGFFTHPNLFSQVIIPYFVVFTMSWLLSDRKLSPRSLKYLLLGAVFGVVLLFTWAKGAMLWSLLGVAVCFAMAKVGRLRSVSFLAGSWLLVVLAINSLALLISNDLLEVDALRTLLSRAIFIATSYNIFTDHPGSALWGGGMRFWETYVSTWSSWAYPNAHNVYLNQMLLYGFIGLCLFLSLIMLHVRRALLLPRVPADPLMSSLPYLAAIFAVTGSYFFEPSFADPIQKYQLFFMLVMAVSLPKLDSHGAARSQTSHPQVRYE